MQPDKPSVISTPQSKMSKRQRWTLFGTAVAGAIFFAGCTRSSLSPTVLPAGAETTVEASVDGEGAIASEPVYQAYELENATVHVVTLPTEPELSIEVADELTTVEEFAQQTEALVVLNAGFFDPQNGKTTSHLVSRGQMVGDPADNERLVDNPDLAPYMDQILNRSEFRVHDCKPNGLEYDIAPHDAVPTDCTIESAVGAGPQLLPEDTSFEEGFTDFEDGELVRDAIGSRGPNARSAIALTANQTVLLIMVAQRPNAPGLTLLEVADFAASIGAVKLLNLDGGSSSSLYYDGQTYLGRLDAEGNPIERPVKSVIVVSP